MLSKSTQISLPLQFEEWRPIADYDGMYEVSNLGRVRRTQDQYGRLVHRFLRPDVSTHGYLRVCLSAHSSERRYSIHRLVASAFVPAEAKKPQINHIDGIKTNNHADNLEWCTCRENNIHGRRLGLQGPQTRWVAPGAKLTEEQVEAIRALPHRNARIVGLQFGVGETAVGDIWAGRSWHHLA